MKGKFLRVLFLILIISGVVLGWGSEAFGADLTQNSTDIAKQELLSYYDELSLVGEDSEALLREILGNIDAQDNDQDRSFFVGIGKYRLDLMCDLHEYRNLCKSKESDELHELISELGEIHSEYDEKIAKAETFEKARVYIREAEIRFRGILCKLEVGSFRAEFGELISETGRIGDKERYLLAIEEYGKLQKEAREVLEREADVLVSGARAAYCDYITSFVSNSDRKMTAEKLCLQVNNVKYTAVDDFVYELRAIEKKTEAAFKVYEVYEEICRGANYPMYDVKQKEKFLAERDSYILVLLSDGNTSDILDSALLELKRSLCEAEMLILSKNGDSEKIVSIITNGIAQLRYFDDIASLENVLKNTKLNVCCTRVYEELYDSYDEGIKSVSDLVYISEEKRSEIKENMRLLLSCAEKRIFSSVNEEEAKAEGELFKQDIMEMVSFANEEDLNSARGQFLICIEQKTSESKKLLSELQYISGDLKGKYIDKLEIEKEKCINSVKEASSPSEMENAYFIFSVEWQKLWESAYNDDLEQSKYFWLEKCNKIAEASILDVSAMKYLENTDKTDFKDEINKLLEKCTGYIGSAKRVAEIADIYDMFCAENNKIISNTNNKNLYYLKKYYIEKSNIYYEESRKKAEALKYISEDRRAYFNAEIENGFYVSKAEINRVANEAEANDIFEKYVTKINIYISSAMEEELLSAKEYGKSTVTENTAKATEIIFGSVYLMSNETEKLVYSLEEEKRLVLVKVFSASDTNSIELYLNGYKNFISDLLTKTASMDLEYGKKTAILELEREFLSYDVNKYNGERYFEMENAVLLGKNAINGCECIEDLSNVLLSSKRKMRTIPTIFEELRYELQEKLRVEFEQRKMYSANYGEKNYALLCEMYSTSASSLSGVSETEGSEKLRGIYERAMAMMSSVSLQWIGSGDFRINSSGYAEYPAGYDHIENGLWGSVFGSEGVPYGSTAVIRQVGVASLHKKSLNNALKKGLINCVGEQKYTSKELREIISRLDVCGVIDIRLLCESKVYNEFSGDYTVRILLPEELLGVENIKVVYISQNGEGEFFDVSRKGSVIEFKTSHFSEFLILGEKRNAPTPILIVLTLLLFLTVLTILGVIFRRRKTDESQIYAIPEGKISTGYAAMLPPLLESVSVEKARTMLSDRDAEEFLVRESSVLEEKRVVKKGFINVDTLSETFDAGDVVTLDILKRRGLVPKGVTYLKVLARGRIDKPLEVRAQSFSKDAIKMITLTGGRAVVEE